MKKQIFAFALVLAFQPVAHAAGWTTVKCSSADGKVKINNEQVTVGEENSYIPSATLSRLSSLSEQGGQARVGIFANSEEALSGRNQKGTLDLKTIELIGGSFEAGCSGLDRTEATVELNGVTSSPVRLLCEISVIAINNDCE